MGDFSKRFDGPKEKPYRDCMAEIIGVLKKYDMAGAITVVSKDRCMFKYHFPKWTAVEMGEQSVRLRLKSSEFASKEAAHECAELTAHAIMQMGDCAAKDGREVKQALARHRNKGGITFGSYADAKIADLCKSFKNDKHKAQWTMTLGDAYCRSIRGKPIDTVSTADVLAILQPIWQSKPETASRIRGRIEKVLDSATAEGHRKGDNPARWRGHLDAVLSKPSKLTRGHHRALPWQDMPSFMERLRGYQSMSALALEWCILTASRTQETAHARRSEIDIKARVWTVPAIRMKGKREHRVPLCDRCLAIFEEATKLNSEFLFPGTNFRHPLSLSAMAEFLKGLSVNATVHGFRSSFRDWCGDATSYPEAIAEAALAHTIGNKTEAAYRRGDALERRRELMAAWARYLDKKDNVVELRTTSGR